MRSNRERLGRLERETTKNVCENKSRSENRTLRRNVQPDHDGMNLRNIKLEAPAFDGQLDPQFSLDWTSNMDHYLLSDKRQIRFAKMKLIGQTRRYWTNIENLMTLRRQEPIQTWNEMKLKLQEKYLPISYKQRLLDQW